MKFEPVMVDGESLIKVIRDQPTYECEVNSTLCYFLGDEGCTRSSLVSCSDPDSFFLLPQQAIQLRLKS